MEYLIYTLVFLIIMLVILILALDLDYKEKLRHESTTNEKVLKRLAQEMLNIMSLDTKASDKIVDLNKTLISSFKVKYSSICLYDGYSYEVKASNVEDEYIDSIKNIASDNDFKKNILKRNVKYIVADKDKSLLYRSAIERNIKSAILIPICFEQNFLGFVLLEDTSIKNLKILSKDALIEIKKNIASFIENIEFQNILETANIVDTQTGFYNNVYLYTNARKFLATYNNTAMIIVKLVSLPTINDKYTRNIGNLLLVKIANATKEILGNDNVYVRYSGLRLIIFVKNNTAESIQPMVERLLSKYKNIYEYVNDEKVTLDTQILLHTLRKQNNIEKEIQKTMSYIDWMKAVNTIKII